MENIIQGHKDFVRSQIEKSFGVENDIEKAHNVGDVHPNGKWVWTEYAPGKFDWRNRKAKTNAQPSGHKPGETKSATKSNPEAAKKVLDFLQLSNNKYNDITKVGALKTDKGNWALSYDGHDVCTVGGKSLSEKTLKDAGVKIEDPNKEHKDYDFKIGGKPKAKDKNDFGSMKFTEMLDVVNEWSDDEFEDEDLNKKLTAAIKDALKKENIDEKKFTEILKKYPALGMSYKDYVDTSAEDLDNLLEELDDWSDDDWMDEKKNAEFDSKMRAFITKHELSEKQFYKLAHEHPGYGLNYEDYIPKGSYKYKKYNGEA